MRVHAVTHPAFGKVTWPQLQEAQKKALAVFGRRLCSWCQQPVPKGARTRCGRQSCDEALWMAQSWQRCVRLALRRDRGRCVKCGKGAAEVDHVVPVSLGGTGDLSNLRSLCTGCHREATRRLRVEKDKYVAR